MIYCTRLRLKRVPPASAEADAHIFAYFVKEMLPKYDLRVVIDVDLVDNEVDIDVQFENVPTRLHGWWRQRKLRRLIKKSRYTQGIEILWEI